MAGPDPHRQLHRLGDLLPEHLGQALAGGHLDALHAEDEGLARHVVLLDLPRQLPQLLGADGDDHHRPEGQRRCQVVAQLQRSGQGLVFVLPLGPQLSEAAGTGTAPQ